MTENADKIDMLVERIEKLTEVVKASVEVNDELREIIKKGFEEVKKAEEPPTPVDDKDDREAEEEIVDEAKSGEADKDSNDGTPVETGDEQKHEEATEEIVKAATPEPPGDAVEEDDVVIKFLKGEIDIPELDKVFG